MSRLLPRSFSRFLTVAAAAVVVLVLAVSPAQAQKKAADAVRPATPAASKPSDAAKPANPALIDINRATAAQLETVPGIGKAYAGRIIAGRPYANKAQLVQKGILTQGLYDKIKDRLIAKQ